MEMVVPTTLTSFNGLAKCYAWRGLMAMENGTDFQLGYGSNANLSVDSPGVLINGSPIRLGVDEPHFKSLPQEMASVMRGFERVRCEIPFFYLACTQVANKLFAFINKCVRVDSETR